eukprot:SAG11_NODE_1035_length_6090_cov_64.023035_5_plen_152_part_00
MSTQIQIQSGGQAMFGTRCEANGCKTSRKIASAMKKNMVVSPALLITNVVCCSKGKLNRKPLPEISTTLPFLNCLVPSRGGKLVELFQYHLLIFSVLTWLPNTILSPSTLNCVDVTIAWSGPPTSTRAHLWLPIMIVLEILSSMMDERPSN